MTDENSRRTFIRTAGSVTALALAGCTGGGSEDGSAGDDMDDGEEMTEDGMSDEEMTEDEMKEDEMSEDGMSDEEMTEDGMDDGMAPSDPEEAPRASIDRFSEQAGTLHVRGPDTDLPEPDEPVNFDQNFLTQGFGPDGDVVQYYDFDAQPTDPAPIYAFVYENGDPVEDQLNVVGAVPGDEGYNDFWQVNRVTVPDEYEANAITSVGTLMDTDYDIESTDVVKNCPIVPDGSTASMHHGDGTGGLVEGWYDGQVVSYFLFEEASLETTGGSVPVSPIYVSFNRNPGEEGGGPRSGFMTEAGSDQTHNVVATLPDQDGYSPLWLVNVYDNADFESVADLDSATDATVLDSGAATVNCPVVSTE